MELLQRLRKNPDAADIASFLQLLQDDAAPFLSQEASGVSPASSFGRNRDSSSEMLSAGQRPLRPRRSNAAKRYDDPESSTRDGSLVDGRGLSATSPGVLLPQAAYPSSSSCRAGPASQAVAMASERKPRRRGFDISSFDEFPPMKSDDSAASRKGKSSCKGPRRITPTSLDKQASIPQFETHSTPQSWQSNPAFTDPELHSGSGSPSCLRQEREMLKKERSRRTGHSSEKSIYRGGVGSGFGKQPSAPFELSGRHKDDRYRSPKTQSPGGQECAHDDSLDSKIAGHSVFDLTRPCRASAKLASPDEHPSSYRASAMEEGASRVSMPQVVADGNPLTSTPFSLPRASPSRPHRRVSLSGVADRSLLDTAADTYANLIQNRLVPNITSEVYFAVQLLTITAAHSSRSSFVSAAGDLRLFASANNCVYFAAAVLSRIKFVLTAFDRPTLQLLAENMRIAEFQPELAMFFAKAYAKDYSNQSTSQRSLSYEGSFSGVPFQEETDNSSNFHSLRAFHAFKKQRDLFYSVLRDWEKHHETPKWTMQLALGDRIRSLVSQTSALSHAHFARLFQKQLVESCRAIQAIGNSSGGSSLMGQLKNADPDRLMRLNERFVQPSCHRGPCPPPAFSQKEDFFAGFIAIADSYAFNQHLMSTLYMEILRLHGGIGSLQPKDVPDTLCALRTMAKFLGFIEFSPYKNPSPPSSVAARSKVCHFDVLHCVQEARVKGHLPLTIPWVVEYLSMMDPQAAGVDHHSTLLHTLVDVYRSLPLESVAEYLLRDNLLVVLSLGWLFENPSVPLHMFFEHMKSSNGQGSVTELPETPVKSQECMVTVDILYSCCSFLAEIRLMLAEFAAGLRSRGSPIKKIKPLPAEPESNSIVSPDKQLQIQLQDCFFRSHPTYLRQLCDITAERIAGSAIALCESRISPVYIVRGVQELSRWIRDKCASLDIDKCTVDDYESFIKVDGDGQVMTVSMNSIDLAIEDAKGICHGYCSEQLKEALHLLLASSLSDEVISTAASITSVWASDRCSRWYTEKLKPMIHEELSRTFDRLCRAVKLSLKKRRSDQLHSSEEEGSERRSSDQNVCAVVSLSSDSALITASERGSAALYVTRALPEVESPESDSSAVKKLMVLANRVLLVEEETITEVLLELQKAIQLATIYIESTASVLPGVLVPQLVPEGMAELSTVTVDLVTHLATHGLLKPHTSEGELDLLEAFLTIWKLLKSLKLDIPIRRLMSGPAMHQGDGWPSLSNVLVRCVESEITSSANVEALWLCRHQQLCGPESDVLVRAAAVFLDHWYRRAENIEYIDNGCGTSLKLLDVHFVRLLSVILSEMEPPSVPTSLLCRSHLKAVMHPF